MSFEEFKQQREIEFQKFCKRSIIRDLEIILIRIKDHIKDDKFMKKFKEVFEKYKSLMEEV